MIDPAQLRRVLDNLLTNSREALQNQTGVDPFINLTTKVANDGYVISIRDNGPGIPSRIRETLFEPLVTNGKKNGTGMGLWNVQKIIEGHYGTISVESDFLDGTNFLLRMPLRFERRVGPSDRRGSMERRDGPHGRRTSDSGSQGS
jgi:signal transduction histidine kinase